MSHADECVVEFMGEPGKGRLGFWCPGCREMHAFDIVARPGRPTWSWNGDFERPTFSPSLQYVDGSCHLIVTDGVIHYCSDCRHELAGKSTAMVRAVDW